MAFKQSTIVVCLAFVILTSNCVSFVCGRINATIYVSIVPSEEYVPVSNKLFIREDNVPVFFNVSSTSTFFIIQAHSFNFNITLSSNYSDEELEVTGSSIGLVQRVNTTDGIYTFHLESTNTSTAMVSLQPYYGEAPVPGGCNMVLEPKDAPYQVLQITDAMIIVDVQQASVLGRMCESYHVKLEMYHYFFETGFNDEAGYFDNIAKMETVEGILKYGKKVGQWAPKSSLRRYYNNYKRWGVVFGAIATYGNESSAYIPAATFGCNRLPDDTTCTLNYLPLHIPLICSGALAALSGRSQLLVSNIVALIITVSYVISSLFISEGSLIITFVVCTFFILLYKILKVFEMDKYLNALVAAYMLTDITFFTVVVDTFIFKNDELYWINFVSLAIMLTVILLKYKYVISFITSFVYLTVGFSAMFNTIQFYIFVTDYRRKFTPKFNMAIIDPVYFSSDNSAFIIASVMYLCINVIAWLCRRQSSIIEERTPLLA